MSLNTAQAAYTQVPADKVGDALSEMFEGDSVKGGSAASQANLIFFVANQNERDVLEQALETIAVVHPSRIFIIQLYAEDHALRCFVSARCHLVSGGEPVCSEVVALEVGEKFYAQIPSVLRSAFVTGVPAELVLSDFNYNKEAIRLVLPLVDRLIIDSKSDTRSTHAVAQFLDSPFELIDIEWLRVAPWREEVRHVFERATHREALETLSEIRLRERVSAAGALPIDSFLVAGWLLSRLGFTPISYTSRGVECRSANGKQLTLSIVVEEEGEKVGLQELSLHFLPGKARSKPGTVQIARTRGLECVVQLDQHLKTSRPLDDESNQALLHRYFAHGGSFHNYRSSARIGHDIERLRQGFLG